MAENNNQDVRGLIRLLVIVESAERVGLPPVSARLIHTIAYLSNALSPIWDLAPQSPGVLKLLGGPYDPHLQHDLDRLVGRGLLLIHRPNFRFSSENGWRLNADYELHEMFSRPVLNSLDSFPDEIEARAVVHEVCLALAAVSPSELDRLIQFDVAYGDPAVSPNSVVQLAEADGSNASSRMAGRFSDLSPRGDGTSPAEEAHLYIRHLLRISTKVSS